MAGTYRVPAPARRVGAVLGAPQSWPWLSGADLAVGFLRRVGGRAFYRADDAAGGGPVYFAVEHDGRAGALWLVDGEAGTPPPSATSTWTVEDRPDGTSELRSTGHDELPGVLRGLWARPAFADTLGAYSAEIDLACGHTDPRAAARALAPMLRARAGDSEA
ncbi:hypothetical protein, partial [Saccharomonospora halophila]|uniref:hypothetical protein n=1 Tax=Saccharomonospora halophila TaxID=129922 RepID=UPI0018DE46E1